MLAIVAAVAVAVVSVCGLRFAQIAACQLTRLRTCSAPPASCGLPNLATTFFWPIPAFALWPHAKHHQTVSAPHILACHLQAILHAMGFAILIDGSSKCYRANKGDCNEGSHLAMLETWREERVP